MSRGLAKLLLLAAILPLLWVGLTPAADDKPVVKIGMLKSVFRETSQAATTASSSAFSGLVYSQTGMKGELVIVDTFEDMRQKLMDGELQLGAFHGFEFAWMKLKEPQLQPLMLAATNPNSLKTVVVVKADNQASDVGALQGKTMAIPNGTREHGRLYIARQCRRNGLTVEQHFAETPITKTVEDALDDVVEGKTTAAVADMASLQTYERRKSGRFAQLKILQSSDQFPASVIAYRQGGLDLVALERFRHGMSTAHQSAFGSRLMSLMKINAFEPIPANYDQIQADIIKAYPPPWILSKN
jgi:ABC-type phosphate/phosphonate transport system substrate-binding protein